ncbi:MAG: pentapeptide repeat-containing protein [Thiomargarita sp.]|nr:pentapeptide repeat-containing protein [Thiomargarita sp.]
MISKIQKWFATLYINRPLLWAFCVFLIATCIVVPLSLPFYFDGFRDFMGNVLVEAHGLLIELLFVGVFVVWLQKLGNKQLYVQMYRREINSYLGWRDEEAMYKIVAKIKKLNVKGVSKIKLTEAFLRKAHLSNANLSKSDLRAADLVNARLINTNLTQTDLRKADLRGADLRNANLKKAKLNGATLMGAIYNKKTIWPKDFDFEAHGVIYSDKKILPRF